MSNPTNGGEDRRSQTAATEAVQPAKVRADEWLGQVDYPRFADPLLEIEWLRGKLMRLQGLLHFQTERLRVRQNWGDAERELRELHARRNEELTQENDELMRSLAQAKAALARRLTTKTPRVTEAEHNAFPNGRWL